MRVAIFTETFVPQLNGVVTRLRQTLAHLRGWGDQVLLFAPAPAGGAAEAEAGVRRVPAVPLPLYPEIGVALPRPSVGSALDEFRPDVVHLVNPAVLGVAGLYYARTRGVPVLASFHTNLPGYLRHYGLGRLEGLAWELLRTIHNRADRSLCVSQAAASELVEHGFERVAVGWRGGVDSELFTPRRASAAMRARLSQDHADRPLLLSVGRLGAEKRIEELREVLSRVPGARLAIVGEGPHRESLEEHFAGCPVVFAGRLEGDELAAAYASADAFLLASPTETLGLVILEAMAAGCPVVAARAGGIVDLVDDGVDGLLFEVGDGERAAAAVRRLLASPELGRRIRGEARRGALRRGWRRATAELRRAYQAVIREAGAERAA